MRLGKSAEKADCIKRQEIYSVGWGMIMSACGQERMNDKVVVGLTCRLHVAGCCQTIFN